MGISGKKIVITGASSGIGKNLALLLASFGAKLILIARRENVLNEVAEAVREKGGEASIYPADLSDAGTIKSLCEKIQNQHGSPDVLVNNAGVGRWLRIDETSEEEFASINSVPYVCSFLMSKYLLPGMLERASGKIVNITSPAALAAIPNAVAYSVSRNSIRHFSECLEGDLSGTGVEVACVVLGKVKTPYFDNNEGSEERIPKIAFLIPTLDEAGAARILKDAIERGNGLIQKPFMLWAFGVLNHFFPWLVRFLLRLK